MPKKNKKSINLKTKTKTKNKNVVNVKINIFYCIFIFGVSFKIYSFLIFCFLSFFRHL